MACLPLSRDAAMVYGLASTALPFAQSADDQVERWLRPLRLYGESAGVLLELGIGEAPLVEDKHRLEDPDNRPCAEVLSAVATGASEFAAHRGMAVVGTLDLMIAVVREYPEAFERALTSRGSDTAELVERLAVHLDMALH